LRTIKDEKHISDITRFEVNIDGYDKLIEEEIRRSDEYNMDNINYIYKANQSYFQTRNLSAYLKNQYIGGKLKLKDESNLEKAKIS